MRYRGWRHNLLVIFSMKYRNTYLLHPILVTSSMSEKHSGRITTKCSLGKGIHLRWKTNGAQAGGRKELSGFVPYYFPFITGLYNTNSRANFVSMIALASTDWFVLHNESRQTLFNVLNKGITIQLWNSLLRKAYVSCGTSSVCVSRQRTEIHNPQQQ